MDVQQTLADLTEISSQIQAAVIFDQNGKVAGSTLGDPGRAEELARSASQLLGAADDVKPGDSPLTQLEVAMSDGSVFVVRDGLTCIAATTGGNPTVGLVFYDLKSALRSVKTAAPARKRAPRKVTTAKKTTARQTAKKAPARKPTTRKKKPDDAS